MSGSYVKHTSIRPVLGDKKRDVDIIVVTSHTSDEDSADVLTELKYRLFYVAGNFLHCLPYFDFLMTTFICGCGNTMMKGIWNKYNI